MAILEVTDSTFEQTLAEHDTVIIDFWAPWCGPCKSFGPIFEKTSEEYPDVLFAKVNTDENPGLAGHFGIRSIPTLAVLRDRILLFAQPGALPESVLKQVVDKTIALDMDEVRADMEAEKKTEEATSPAS